MRTVKFLVFLIVMLVISCSKEETETALTDINGGQISHYQLVTVDFGSNTLPNDTYTGTFNNEPITLSKIEENKLLFYVKETTPLGQTQLIIPSLNNTKVTYEVVEATLTQSPAATLQPLIDFQAQYGATLTDAPEDASFLQNHNAFTQYFANLSDEDRIKAAKFYKTNKAVFDAVYNTNYDNVQGRNANETQADFDFQLYRSLILRHKLAVVVTVIAGTLAATPPYEPIETSISTAVALAGIYKASNFHKQIIDDVFRVVQIKLDDTFGSNNRTANTTNATLSLTDNQAKTLPFAVNARSFTNADGNVQKEFVQTYFTAKNKLNTFINKLNTAIDWLNNNIFLSSLSTINTIDVPNDAALDLFEANTQLMQNFTFSVNHPNLSLETATLSSIGQLNLKVKVTGNPNVSSISSTLNYTYNDDFSSFSGSFPIEVNEVSACESVTDIDGNVYESVTIGTQCWMKSNLNVSRYRNGDIIPQVTDPAVWSQLTTGAWCYYENNTANGTIYGKLYNWYAITDPRGLAPEGWHIPLNNEWDILSNYLGGDNIAGGKLKATTSWNSPNTGATNSSGFSALAGGRRGWNGDFNEINYGADFANYDYIWYRSLSYNTSNFGFVINNNRLGLYVRCVKD